MPNTPIAECAHLHLNEWLDDSDEWFTDSTVEGHGWVLPSHRGMKAAVSTSTHHKHKRQVKGIILYADGICELASHVLIESRARLRKQSESVIVPSVEQSLIAQRLLEELEAMLNEKDEPDFLNRPTPFAYDTAREFIKDAYTHYVGSPPRPTLGPDGDGGMVAEWQSGQRIVRLVVAPDKNAKTYIYRRGNNESAVDHVPSGTMLAQRLLTVFG